MQAALEGALIGLGVGVFLIAAEYYFIRKHAQERAVRQHQREAQLDSTDKRRLASITSFSACLPPAFAVGFWLVWG